MTEKVRAELFGMSKRPAEARVAYWSTLCAEGASRYFFPPPKEVWGPAWRELKDPSLQSEAPEIRS
eukprot:scaffold1945_cov204-Pinguiococcus_pyrenoidosus.AAC.2